MFRNPTDFAKRFNKQLYIFKKQNKIESMYTTLRYIGTYNRFLTISRQLFNHYTLW